jgi:hypothetical protein
VTYKYFENQQIDKRRWDELIDSCEQSMVYAKSWFLDIVAPGWGAFIDDRWQWVMPVPCYRKYAIPYVLQPMFCQQLGVFGVVNSSFQVELLISDLKKRFPFVVYQFNRFNTLKDVKVNSRTTFELPLIADYQSLKQQFSDSHQKNIRRAQRFECKIVAETDTKPFISLLQQMYSRKNLDAVKEKHYKALAEIFEYGIHHTPSELIYVYNQDNQIIAGVYFLCHQQQTVLFTARNQEGFEKKSTFLLVDDFIRRHADSAHYIDFAGSDLKGIAEFNKGWGAKEYQYSQFKSRWL